MTRPSRHIRVIRTRRGRRRVLVNKHIQKRRSYGFLISREQKRQGDIPDDVDVTSKVMTPGELRVFKIRSNLLRQALDRARDKDREALLIEQKEAESAQLLNQKEAETELRQKIINTLRIKEEAKKQFNEEKEKRKAREELLKERTLLKKKEVIP